MNDQLLTIVGAVTTVIVALGTAFIAIAKKAVTAIVEQNAALTGSIRELTANIQRDLVIRDERDKSKFELLRDTKQAAEESKDMSAKLLERLRGRL